LVYTEEYIKEITDHNSIVKQLRELHCVTRFDNETKNEKEKIIIKCSTNDCNGFLDSSFKCSICEQPFCKHCHENNNSESEHVCNKGLVETIKLLKKDTKPCPKCYANIYKISGCNEMFCNQCATSFDWKSLVIIKGSHNPHLFEWLKTNAVENINVDFGQCGRGIDNNSVRYFVAIFKKYNFINIEYLRNFSHNVYYSANKFTEINTQNFNKDLRIKYIVGEINKEDFKMKLQRLNKKNEKYNDIRHILIAFQQIITDFFYKLAENLEKLDPEHEQYDAQDFYNEFLMSKDQIIEYTNSVFKDISDKYSCVEYAIDSNLHFVTSNKK
jgi:hypothetical protein